MARRKNQHYEEMDYALSKPIKTLATVVRAEDKDLIQTMNTELKAIIASNFGNKIKVTEISKGSELEKDIYNTVVEYFNEQNFVFEPIALKAEIINNFVQSLSGFGAIQPLMDDDEIEEIYVYAPDKIYYLKNGAKYLSDVKFDSPERLKGFIDNVLGRINRTVNTKSPIEDGRLPDGSRVAVSTGALSPNGDTINIRKFRKRLLTLDDMVENKTMDEKTKELLIQIINSSSNFLVSGGTASGKTTLLNAMAQFIPGGENVTSIEDNIELQLNREFWLQLETRKANIEGEGEVTMEDLLVHLLRRSPDRIVLGEVRTGKVADTLMNAIQTGHDGTCATIHANNIERCRARMCKLASVSSGQPFKATCDDFDHSIQFVVQMSRDAILKRRVITEIGFIETGKIYYLVKFNRETETFEHYPYPESLKQLFNERGVDYGE